MRIRAGNDRKHADAYPFVVEYDIVRSKNDTEVQYRQDGILVLSTEKYNIRTKWCAYHMEGAYSIYYSRAGFELESDAMLFVMRWA